MRGPQGTLFGRNTTGGAINVILRKPGKTLGGYAEASYGSYEQVRLRGSIDVPLAETFQIKLSGYWQKDRGYVKNVTTGDRLNDDDGWGARAGDPRGSIARRSLDASFAHIEADGENILNFTCNPVTPTECKGRYASTGLREGKSFATSPYPVPVAGAKANYGQGQRSQTNLVTSNLEIGIADKTTLNLITGFVNLRQQFALDFFDGRSSPTIANTAGPTFSPPVRGLAPGGFDILNDGQHDQFTQEVKLNTALFDGKLNLVAGAYFLREETAPTLPMCWGRRTRPRCCWPTASCATTRPPMRAIFRAISTSPAKIQLTAGVRYTDESKDFTIRDNRPVRSVNALGQATCGTTVGVKPDGIVHRRQQPSCPHRPAYSAKPDGSPVDAAFPRSTSGPVGIC